MAGSAHGIGQTLLIVDAGKQRGGGRERVDCGVIAGTVHGSSRARVGDVNPLVRIQRSGGVDAEPVPDVFLAPVVEKSVLIDVLRRVAIVGRGFLNSVLHRGGQVLRRVHHVLKTRFSVDDSCRSLATVRGMGGGQHAAVIGEVENVAVVVGIVHVGAVNADGPS